MARKFEGQNLEVQLRAANEKILSMATRIKQLEDQQANKTKHLLGIITELRHMESAARSLCTIILSKDRAEMQLGTNYSWGSLGTEELIKKAIASYRAYCAERTQNMQTLKDTAMKNINALGEAKTEILSMQGEIDRLMKEANKQAFRAKEALRESSEEINQAAKAGIEAAAGKALEHLAESVQASTMKAEYDDGDLERVGPVFKNAVEIKMHGQINAENPAAASSTIADKEKEYVEKITVDLAKTNPEAAEIMSKLSTDDWIVIRAIGEYGDSRYTDIANRVSESIAEKKCRRITDDLVEKNVLHKEKISYAGHKNVGLLKLKTIGIALYTAKYGKQPVRAEMDRIVAEHSSYEHGYSIKETYQIMRRSKYFEKLHMWDLRSKFTLDNGDGTFYIPDIVGTHEGRMYYYEYETGNMANSGELNEKLNKMLRQTRDFNFILPNTTLMFRYQKEFYKWAQKNKSNPEVSRITFRMTVYENMKRQINAGAPYDSWWGQTWNAMSIPEPQL